MDGENQAMDLHINDIQICLKDRSALEQFHGGFLNPSIKYQHYTQQVGELVSMSEQQLLDCAPGSCNVSWSAYLFEIMIKTNKNIKFMLS